MGQGETIFDEGEGKRGGRVRETDEGLSQGSGETGMCEVGVRSW